MAFSFLSDPLHLCRKTLDKLENGINTFASRHMDSDEFSQALNCYSRVSLGVQFTAEKSLALLRERFDLPSRGEVDQLAAALRRVEDKLAQLLPDEAPAHRPKPSRTRRSLAHEPEQALADARAKGGKTTSRRVTRED